MGEVLTHRKYGEHYHSLTIVAPEIGQDVEPGQFISIAFPPETPHIRGGPF